MNKFIMIVCFKYLCIIKYKNISSQKKKKKKESIKVLFNRSLSAL